MQRMTIPSASAQRSCEIRSNPKAASSAISCEPDAQQQARATPGGETGIGPPRAHRHDPEARRTGRQQETPHDIGEAADQRGQKEREQHLLEAARPVEGQKRPDAADRIGGDHAEAVGQPGEDRQDAFAGRLQLQGDQPVLDASRAGPEQPFAAETQGHEDRQEQGEADGIAATQHVGQHAAGVGELLRQAGHCLGQGAYAVAQVLKAVAEPARHGVRRVGAGLGGRAGVRAARDRPARPGPRRDRAGAAACRKA